MDTISNTKFTNYDKIMFTIKSQKPCILVKHNPKRGLMKFSKIYYLLTLEQHETLKKYLSSFPYEIEELFEWLKSQANLNMNDEGVWELCTDYSFDSSHNKERSFFNIVKQSDGNIGFWIDE